MNMSSVLMKAICTLDSGADISALCMCACSFEIEQLHAEYFIVFVLFYFFISYVHNKYTVAA